MSHFSVFAKLELFVAAVTGWWLIFLLVDRSIEASGIRQRDLDNIKNRMVSILHGLFSVISTAIHIHIDKPEFAQETNAFQELIILISAGYFFYDMIAIAYYGLTDEYLLVHHALSIFAYITCFVYGNSATEALHGLYLAEVSNFPMHLRSIFKIVDLRYTMAYEITEVLYFLIYIVARGYFLPQLVLEILHSHKTAFGLMVPMFCAYGQAMLYIFAMVNALKKKFGQFMERKRKGVRLRWFKETPELRRLSYYRREPDQSIF